MTLEELQAVAQIGANLTASGILLLAWMLERRRADRLEAIVTTDWLRTRTIDMSKEKPD